jgi:hypothetical protein
MVWSLGCSNFQTVDLGMEVKQLHGKSWKEGLLYLIVESDWGTFSLGDRE